MTFVSGAVKSTKINESDRRTPIRKKVPRTPNTSQSRRMGVNMAIKKLEIQLAEVVTLTALSTNSTK